MMRQMRLFPWRSLRLRVVALLVMTVVIVLAAATALEIRLSTRIAERNLQERALTLAKELDRPTRELLPGSTHLGLAVAPFHLGPRVIGSIRVKASLAEVERLSNLQARQALLLTLLCVLGISAVLGLILTRTIARPIRLL